MQQRQLSAMWEGEAKNRRYAQDQENALQALIQRAANGETDVLEEIGVRQHSVYEQARYFRLAVEKNNGSPSALEKLHKLSNKHPDNIYILYHAASVSPNPKAKGNFTQFALSHPKEFLALTQSEGWSNTLAACHPAIAADISAILVFQIEEITRLPKALADLVSQLLAEEFNKVAFWEVCRAHNAKNKSEEVKIKKAPDFTDIINRMQKNIDEEYKKTSEAIQLVKNELSKDEVNSSNKTNTNSNTMFGSIDKKESSIEMDEKSIFKKSNK
jgi:hypothetical protein